MTVKTVVAIVFTIEFFLVILTPVTNRLNNVGVLYNDLLTTIRSRTTMQL